MSGARYLAPGALAMLLLAGCSSSSSHADGGADAAPGGYSLPEFQGGFSFFMSLPPDFSPFLPLSGDEATREPAGFHDSTSDYYFSYEFIWWLTGTPDLTTTGLRGDLSDYFNGLCGSTTATVTLDDPASAVGDAGLLVARRSGTLDAGSCFNAAVPAAALDVSTYHCPDHTAVIVLVSPQPAASQVWTDLRAVRDGFSCY